MKHQHSHTRTVGVKKTTVEIALPDCGCYRYKATPKFWRSYAKLTPHQQQSVLIVWKMFREYPFHPRLRAHKIQRLSAAAKRTVYAVEIEADLRAVFILDGETIVTLDIGSHAIYKP